MRTTAGTLAWGLLVGLLAVPSSQASEAEWAAPCAVEVIRDLAYYEGADAHPVKHKLDLYLPKGRKDFPVVLFVHGGAWRSGDKNYFFDVYGQVGRMFARNGMGAVVINYRLAPQFKHPAHIEDVARAFAWTYRNIARYGGRPDQLFVCGHSAGGHLVALLATDGRYLDKEKLSPDHIRGVIGISGVYAVPSGNLFNYAFGPDDEVKRQASPISHVAGNHPPFLLLYADGDLPTLDVMAQQMADALRRCRCDVRCTVIEGRDHYSIVARLAHDDDPTTRAVLAFIAQHTEQPLTTRPRPASHPSVRR